MIEVILLCILAVVAIAFWDKLRDAFYFVVLAGLTIWCVDFLARFV